MSVSVTGYTDFAEKLLIALYQESENAEPDERFEDILQKYGLPQNTTWLQRLTSEWEQNGFVEVNSFIGSPLRWSGEISGPGMRYVEGKYGSKDGVGMILEPVTLNNVLLTEDGQPILTEDGQFIELESSELVQSSASMTIDSADWTGIAQRLETDPVVVQEISKHINEIDQLVERSGLTNTERQKAKAITEALKLLIASPEPEWKAVALLLTSPALTAVLNVAAIVQIVLKLFGIG